MKLTAQVRKNLFSWAIYEPEERGGISFQRERSVSVLLRGEKRCGKMTGSIKLPLVQGHKKMTGATPLHSTKRRRRNI
jgi:hypothetical protein